MTNIDSEIEKYIIAKIQEAFSSDNFITEETYPNNEVTNRTWVIDPIDGTNYFIKGTHSWGIQLAFYTDDSVKFSVIYLPRLNELYYAIENQGAYLNNHKIVDIKINPLNQSIIEFGGSIYKEINKKKEVLAKLMDSNGLKVANILYINACCISYTNLASNKQMHL